MNTKILIFVLGFLMAGQVHAQEKAIATAKRSEFVKTSIVRLTGKVSTETLDSVSKKADTWRQTESDADWIEFTDTVYREASAAGLRFDVKISTSGGRGASVRYQTLGERKRGVPPTTAKGLTTLTERMPIGMYHIWSERQGKATSSKDAQYEIGVTKGGIEEVTLEEFTLKQFK